MTAKVLSYNHAVGLTAIKDRLLWGTVESFKAGIEAELGLLGEEPDNIEIRVDPAEWELLQKKGVADWLAQWGRITIKKRNPKRHIKANR